MQKNAKGVKEQKGTRAQGQVRSRAHLLKGRSAEAQQDNGSEGQKGSKRAKRQECKNAERRKSRSAHRAKVLKSKDAEVHEGRLAAV